MQPNSVMDQRYNTRRLTIEYIVVLVVIALLVLGGQVLFISTLNTQRDDVNVVNISGRQRMLSQKISKLALEIEDATGTLLEEKTDEFDESVEEWTSVHQAFLEGDESRNIPRTESSTILELFDEIQPNYQAIADSAVCVIAISRSEDNSTCDQPLETYVDQILENEDDFLTEMNSIVFAYDNFAQEEINALEQQEFIIIGVVLATIVLLGLFVFRPAIRGITETLDQLLEAQDELRREHTIAEEARHEAEEARHHAEESDRVKSAFLAAMSHELRTPLNSIINFTKFVHMGAMGEINEKQKKTLARVVDSANHLLDLINDVLDISKIESGSLHLFVEDDVDVTDLLERVETTIEPLMTQKDEVELKVNVADDFPKIRADRQRIYQILLNIMSNAVKFTEKGSIEVEAKRNGDHIVIAIADTGVGIDAEDHGFVFESFKQTDSGLRGGGGTGLGMPISKSLAEQHHGKLWFDSEKGKGSTFYIELPIRSDQLEVVNL